MGVTNELGVRLAPGATNICRVILTSFFAYSINHVIKQFFFLNLTFVLLRSTLLVASGIGIVFGAWVG